jgi:hypothetical protein
VTVLNTTVAEREDTLRTREVQLEDRRREMATVFYVVGDKDMLKEFGRDRVEGRRAGGRKDDHPLAYAEPGRLHADRYRPGNRHPHADREGAPHLGAAGRQLPLALVDGHMELHIIDPIEFRKVKQVVILSS